MREGGNFSQMFHFITISDYLFISSVHCRSETNSFICAGREETVSLQESEQFHKEKDPFYAQSLCIRFK